jgi:bifunctional non-homologous end joining protein LigD
VSSKAIGSLVLGYFDDGKLIHAGRVGTGRDSAIIRWLRICFAALTVSACPKARLKKLAAEDARRVRFVRPELVAEVEFRVWTAEGLIGHASFRGLREDKRAEEVVLEMHRQGSAHEQAV